LCLYRETRLGKVLKHGELGSLKMARLWDLRFVVWQKLTNVSAVLTTSIESGSSVIIITGYGLDDRGSIPGRVKGLFLYPLCPYRLWSPPSLLYNWYRGSFPGGKARLGRDADHSPASRVEVENE
jgi:hypothetical protein